MTDVTASRSHRLPVLKLLIAVTLTGGSRTMAEDRPELRIGFDGSYKVGRWTPIDVEFGNGTGVPATCDVVVPDADGNETVAPLTPVSQGRFAGVFRSGRLNAPIRVQTDSGFQAVAPLDDGVGQSGENTSRPARQSVVFLGAVGAAPWIEQAVDRVNRTSEEVATNAERARAIRFPDWSALPESGPAWEALDVLFVSDDLPETDQQSDALRNWVRRGGHLVLSVGNRSDAVQSSPLAGWLPTRIDGTRTVNELATIADRVPAADPLPARAGLVAARLDPAGGAVLLSTFEGPLITRFAYGVGMVTLFALDIQAPPMSEWNGTPPFCLFLADVELEDEAVDAPASRLSGVSDLATQVASSLDWFPDVAKPSYGTVLLAVLCFLVIVGPIDYFLVHRFLKRPRRTWITFTLAALMAAGCGAFVARRAHPPRTLVNQLELVDIDVTLSTAHVRNWATLYSPAPRRYPVEFTADPWFGPDADTAARVSWFGKPESGFRGMYRTGGLDLGKVRYEFATDYTSVRNLPVDQWSTRSLSAEWEQQLESVPVRSDLADDGAGELSGSLTHHLPVPITDWMLAYGGYVYFPRGESAGSNASIAPGVPLRPADVLPVPRMLERVLVGYHNVASDSDSETTTPSRRTWDPLDRDPANLIQTITFHTAAGGRSYTGLTNTTLGRSDLSPLLPLQRAVLLGRLSKPAMHCAAGQDFELSESSTFIRIILPVEPATSPDED